MREALRELAATGLVTIKPRRGARVVEMTPDLVGELFELMAEVEAICVRFVTYRIKASERVALSRIHELALVKVQAKDLDAYDVLNQEFHETLYNATHNRELRNFALALRQRGAPFRRAQFRGLERLKASWTEHDTILRAIFEGNGDIAAQLMRAHMLKAGIVFMDYTHDQETAPSSPSPLVAKGTNRRNVKPRRNPKSSHALELDAREQQADNDGKNLKN